MPIYKLSTSLHSAGVRLSQQPPPSDALSVGEKKVNGDVVHSENRGHYQDNTYMQRPSPAEREIDYFDPKKSSSFNRKESIIEREIREQLRRESELAALRGLPTLVKVPVDQVDQNQDHHHHHNHRTQDPSWNYYEVQMLPPEQHRNFSREERKLTVIRSPGGATSSTTTITTTTTSVNGSKPGKVDYRRGGYDMVEQKEREKEEENEDDKRGQWKERGVDLEVETLENGKWTERKRTEKNDEDVLDSGGVIVRNAEKTEEKESPGEERHSSSSVREPWSPAAEVQRNLHRVQPFEEVDSIQSELFAQYVPQNETPIEREIRRANKRESDLRVARGLVSLVSRGDSDGGAETEIEVVVMRPPRAVEGGGDHSIQEKDAMKRFSESRLRAELEREKRREIDLLREGKIKLLSEQRVPELLGHSSSSSRNRVSSETEELREFSARRRSLEHRDSERDVVIAPGAGRPNADADAVENRTAYSANPRMSYGGGGGGSKGVTVVRSDARNVNGSGEGVFMRTTHSATEAERRIENEIVELRKRESELREQRRSRMSDIPVEASAAQPEVVEEHGGAHAQAAKPEVVVAPTSSEDARRRQQQEPEPRFDLDYDSVDLGRPARLALIDQWERGIIQRGGITT